VRSSPSLALASMCAMMASKVMKRI
jgi:hypothetical protein